MLELEDTNGDGVLSFEEFRSAVMRQTILLDAFWTNLRLD